MEFVQRMLNAGKNHFFLQGPTGMGKTPWCTHEFPDALRKDLLNPVILRRYMAAPEYLIELHAANAKAKYVLIDEIQKLLELLEVEHLQIERKARAQFILTGSSARKLRRQGVNSLGGRAAQRFMHPYMAAELGSRFNLDSALRQGMLPVAWAAHNPEAILWSYNALYLHKGADGGSGAQHRRLHPIASSDELQSGLGVEPRQCIARGPGQSEHGRGISRCIGRTAVGFRLEVFAKCAKRELATHPKYYFFDAGKLERNSDLDREDLRGWACAGYVDANVLNTRYFEEVRPYLLSKHLR